MKRYGKYIKPYLWAFILGPVMMIIEVVGEVMLPAMMADIINVGAANHDVGYILYKGLMMAATAFVMMAGGIGGAYFAVKAAPNPFLMEILKEEGCGCDCSSYTELMLSDAVGVDGHDIMFSSNDTPEEDFKLAERLGAIINLDQITELAQMLQDTTPEEPMVEFDCDMRLDGQLQCGHILSRSMWSSEEPPQYIGVIGKVTVHREKEENK